VNASIDPGTFYVDTVNNLCSGTTYQFSAWILSLLVSSACNGAGISPNITFRIETTTGGLIQSYPTGNIPNLSAPVWTQYGFYFSLPPGLSSVVIRMVNNAPGGCGNDLALDDIQFRPCGPKVDAGFATATSDTINYCVTDNQSITLSGSAQTGFINPAFQWQQSLDNGATWTDIPGATTGTYTNTFSSAGSFLYRLTAAEAANIGIPRCRVASNLLTIVIDAIPKPNAGNNSPVCAGKPVTLVASDAKLYTWTGPNNFSAAAASPVITPTSIASQGKYYVQVQTNGGCTALDSTVVVIHPLPVANAGADASICSGNTTLLNATGGTIYAWTPAAGLSNTSIPDPLASPATTTTYIVQVYDQFNCTAADSVLVTVFKSPAANAGPDKQMVAGQTVQLEGAASGDSISYYWTPPLYIINNATSLSPVVSPPVDFTYTLHVVSAEGCGNAIDAIFVRVFQKVMIPNSFSPNGDGINDGWVIGGLDTYPESVTEVFNRYGQQVFRSVGYPKPWDGTYNGKPLPVGTYYYIIDRKNGFPLLSSWVLIIR
jgi:gliding motility-associated-like protein